MNYPTENDVKKLGLLTRCLSALILLCCFVAAIGITYAMFAEPFHPMSVFGSLIVILLSHISGSVVFTGYSPKYLLFAHGPK